MYPPPIRALAAVATAVVALGMAGCGEEDETEVERPRESVHEVPALPAGWAVEENHSGGFALGVPPAWEAQRKGTETVLRSADRLAVVTVKADRSNEALEADLAELADATGVAFGNQFQDYRLGDTTKFVHRYDAYSTTAEGTSNGIGQEIEVFLLRRGDLATFTVLAQLNDELGTDYAATVDRIVSSIRSRPVG